MERNLHIICGPGETITPEYVCCYVQQLLKDLKEGHMMLWQRDTTSGWGTFCSGGLSGNSCIRLSRYHIKKQPVVVLSYEKGNRLIYNAMEFDGNPSTPSHIAHLYEKVSAAVKHRNIFDGISEKDMDFHLSAEDMNERCLKVNELFNTITDQQMVDRLMYHPSTANLNISEDSPEWQRRTKQIHSLVHLIQCTRIRESSLILDGFALKKADGKRYGHITTDPIAKWANAHVIIKPDSYTGLAFDEIRIKVAADIIANLLMIL